MANYAVSDVKFVLEAGDWSDWDPMIKWLEDQPAGDPTSGLSATDKDELLRDLRRARDEGQEFVTRAGELYRSIVAVD
jgi:hypothetical protein